MQAKCLCVLIRVWVEVGVGTVGPVWALQWNIFTDRFRAVLLLWIICVFSVLCLMSPCACLFICAFQLPAWGRVATWLSFVVSGCGFIVFPQVSWVRCGT